MLYYQHLLLQSALIYYFEKFLKLFLFSTGDIVGRPRFFLAPLFISISNKEGPSSSLKAKSALFNSFNVDTLYDFFYLNPEEIFSKSTPKAIVGCPPTES